MVSHRSVSPSRMNSAHHCPGCAQWQLNWCKAHCSLQPEVACLSVCLLQAQPVCAFSISASSVLFNPLSTLFCRSVPRVLFRRSLDYYFGWWGRLINSLAGGWLLWWANVSQILQGGENNSQEYSRHWKQALAIIGPIEILSDLMIAWLNYKFWHLNYKKDLTLFEVIFS